jgi:DNA-binding protein H-NS
MKTAEQEAVLRAVRKLVDFWQIEAHELDGIEPTVVAPQSAVAEPARPCYRHPISGETWRGEGSQPEWLKQALTREGYTVQELRLSAPDDPGASA